MLTLIARVAARRPLVLLVLAAGLLGAFVVFGVRVFPDLISGGFDDSGTEAAQASTIIAQSFGGTPDLAILVTAPAGSSIESADVTTAGKAVTATVAAVPGVTGVTSFFTSPSDSLRSTDKRQALIIATSGSTDAEQTAAVLALRDKLSHPPGGTTVWVGGGAAVGEDIGDQVLVDVGRAESVAVPITVILLLIVFGSVVAALLPLAVGTFAIFGAFFGIYLVSRVTEVSIFSVNLITGLGLGLAIDYSLLIVSRFREEMARSDPAATADGPSYSRRARRVRVEEALVVTVCTAGRTVLFTGLAVSVSLLALLLFPFPFLRSFGYGGVAVVIFSVFGALLVLPAMLAMLGTRVDAGRLGRRSSRGRHSSGSGAVRSASAPSPFWHGLASVVLRFPWLAIPVLVGFAAMASPLLHATFGSPDDRVLNTSAQSRLVGDALRSGFPGTADSASTIVVTGPTDTKALTSYAVMLSRAPGVSAVQSSVGIAVSGKIVDPTPQPARTAGNRHLLEVTGPKDPASDSAKALVTELREIAQPFGTRIVVGGDAATLVDNQSSLVQRLPWAATWIVLTTLFLVFLFTGSVLLPVKAVLMNAITLSAVVGTMTWIFQEGHLSSILRFDAGPVDTSMPILLFCIAFGLSMDYELFLVARIKELHDEGADIRESVAGGLASTGRITSMAAAVLAVTFAAFGTSRVTFIQLFGVGTGLAILLDATIVRGVLVPAFMRVAGEGNWWAPRWLKRVHDRIGLEEATATYTEPEVTTVSARRLEVVRG